MKKSLIKLLTKLKTADLKADVPSVSEHAAQWLHNLVLKRGCKNGLEIGTAHAYSTIWLGDAFEQTGGHLHTIEHSPPSFNQAKINLYRAKLEQTVTQHQGRAQHVLKFELSSDLKFDFIFIDGIKRSTLEFFQLCVPFLAPHGVVVIDDVIKFKPKMTDFYQWLEGQNTWQHTIHQLDADDGIMVIKSVNDQ